MSSNISKALLVIGTVALAAAAFTSITVSGVVLVPAGLAAVAGSLAIDKLTA